MCRCHLHSVLARLNVTLPSEISAEISRYVSLPNEVVRKVKNEAIQLQPIPTIQLGDDATLALLMQLKLEIEHFLSPLDEYLEYLVFFHLHEGNLFFKYVKFYFKKIGDRQAFSPRGSEFFSPVSVNNQDMLLSAKMVSADVVQAIKMAVDLIGKLLEGSATYSEITLEESLEFIDRDIELEFGPLKQFAEVSMKPIANQNCLNGVKDLLDLQDIAKKILTISKVCDVYELQGCTNDKDFVTILGIARNMQDKEYKMNITLHDASSKLHLVRGKLRVSSLGNKEFLDLFSVVQHSIPFYHFAMEKGFGKGEKVFRQQYTLVSAQLQHEEYDYTVLGNLAGAFKFIEPFFDKQQSFGELMDKLCMLTNVTNGIQQLQTVNDNIELIKIWFQKAEVSFEVEACMCT